MNIFLLFKNCNSLGQAIFGHNFLIARVILTGEKNHTHANRYAANVSNKNIEQKRILLWANWPAHWFISIIRSDKLKINAKTV